MFGFSWYDRISVPAAERRMEALRLIRQFYAFILNAVSVHNGNIISTNLPL